MMIRGNLFKKYMPIPRHNDTSYIYSMYAYDDFVAFSFYCS